MVWRWDWGRRGQGGREKPGGIHVKNDEEFGSGERDINGDKATGIAVKQPLEKHRRGDICVET